MTENEKFKNIYENAYNQQKQTVEQNYNQFKNMIENAYLQHIQSIELYYNQFKNMIENAYLQHIQMIKTNASIMKSYSSMFGNSDIAKNIEKMESDFLTLNEESKKSMIGQLDIIKDNYLSNAAKINEGYHKMPSFDKFVPNPDGSVGSK
ncbi:MAG: hypothetical protein P0116_16485 [Candidatus Nitrosocosmicus sp.]|nr:hypothetical protein [Candidatus Nitrosocosmicus sp.]